MYEFIVFLGAVFIVWTVQYRGELKEIKAFRQGYERGLQDGRAERKVY